MSGGYGYTPPADAPPQRGTTGPPGPPGPDVNFADSEIPSGTVDGINQVFTVAHTPNPTASLQVYLNGLLQHGSGSDYTFSGTSITFTIAPLVGSMIVVSYRY